MLMSISKEVCLEPNQTTTRKLFANLDLLTSFNGFLPRAFQKFELKNKLF